MSDPIDQYSNPMKVIDTKLSKLFYMNTRSSKAGRRLEVLYDERFPLIEDFDARYIYTVEFDEIDSEAGNHYHIEKSEYFVPVKGDFVISLEDPKSKESEQIELKEGDDVILYIRSGIAHKVKATMSGNRLLVIATSPGTSKDEIEYILN